MKRDGVLPWLIATIPVLFAFIAEGILYTLYDSDPQRDILIVGTAFVALTVLLSTLFSGYWGYTLLLRYQEQVRLRDNALQEFNAAVDARVEDAVEAQRRSDRLGMQRSLTNAMDETVGLVASRWREPLQRLATLPGKGGDRAEQAEAAALIATSMLESLGEWQEFFRPDTVREAVDLSEAVQSALSLLALELAETDIRVETRLECSMTLPLYRNEIIRVLISLLHNAKEALVERRIALPRIEIECYETGQFVVIRLCDNAGGVAADVADRIFEPYFSTKGDSRAAGLGLYMARNIVEEHCNGELSFDNIDRGACFYLKIGKHQTEEEA
ncbi:HAMP domain-containing histidine kinase [Sulfurimonas sp. HSL-3221]|uniref:sensor histidine kinase n=1 Tax=Sulfurimonadaceae TaxID=2771471 RepID=UPI001E458782|nr:HAMP domain-containing sensor histidine kinase [Sulfurimonas sp. HSL-3221]UFS62144.1 HAMP domain-containing histidine kinase [Sulfurimonas sp. HSL-3221]